MGFANNVATMKKKRRRNFKCVAQSIYFQNEMITKKILNLKFIQFQCILREWNSIAVMNVNSHALISLPLVNVVLIVFIQTTRIILKGQLYKTDLVQITKELAPN